MAQASASLKAVIFDLDGLAVDSEPVHVEAWRRAVEGLGRRFDPSWIGPYFGQPVSATAAGLARKLGVDADELRTRRDHAFAELSSGGIPPREGLLESVRRLREAGLRTGLVTSGTRDYARAVLDALRGEHGIEFDVVVTRDDVRNPKPDPEPYLRAAELLGEDPASCAVLEDAPTGVESAKAAGMAAVAVPNEHTGGLDFSKADSIQPDLIGAVEWLLARG